MDVKVGSMFVDDERIVSNVEVKGHTHCKERDDPPPVEPAEAVRRLCLHGQRNSSSSSDDISSAV